MLCVLPSLSAVYFYWINWIQCSLTNSLQTSHCLSRKFYFSDTVSKASAVVWGRCVVPGAAWNRWSHTHCSFIPIPTCGSQWLQLPLCPWRHLHGAAVSTVPWLLRSTAWPRWLASRCWTVCAMGGRVLLPSLCLPSPLPEICHRTFRNFPGPSLKLQPFFGYFKVLTEDGGGALLH